MPVKIDVARAVEEKLSENHSAFHSFVRKAEGFAARSQFTAAAAYGQMAASYATWNHTGIFASRRLEELLMNMGKKITRESHPQPRSDRRNGGREGVLHVVTEAYPVGGHTRLVWNWIRLDTDRSHSIAFTQQGASSVAPQLLQAVRQASGRVYRLDTRVGSLPARARALRQLALEFDRVVLHIHPADVVPVIAFADRQGLPPVIFMNHADHLFWLGVGISDVVANVREWGLTLCRERRGLDSARCQVLPIPVVPLERSLSRIEAKRHLGLPDESIVLLSVAAEYKFEPIPGETGFVDAILPVLASHDNAFLVVVGPAGGGQWERGARESGGRVRAFGKRLSPTPFYEAADIYLDPFPVSSLTSLLEAGCYGVPLVSFKTSVDAGPMQYADSPGVKDTLLETTTMLAYRTLIDHLIDDPLDRAQIADRTRQDILNTHVGKGWIGSLKRVYAMAGTKSAAELSPDNKDVPEAGILDVWLVSVYSQLAVSHDVAYVLFYGAGLLPFLQRLTLWVKRFGCRPALLPRFLFSERMYEFVRRIIGRGRIGAATHCAART